MQDLFCFVLRFFRVAILPIICFHESVSSKFADTIRYALSKPIHYGTQSHINLHPQCTALRSTSFPSSHSNVTLFLLNSQFAITDKEYTQPSRLPTTPPPPHESSATSSSLGDQHVIMRSSPFFTPILRPENIVTQYRTLPLIIPTIAPLASRLREFLNLAPGNGRSK